MLSGALALTWFWKNTDGIGYQRVVLLVQVGFKYWLKYFGHELKVFCMLVMR